MTLPYCFGGLYSDAAFKDSGVGNHSFLRLRIGKQVTATARRPGIYKTTAGNFPAGKKV